MGWKKLNAMLDQIEWGGLSEAAITMGPVESMRFFLLSRRWFISGVG